MSSDKKNSTKYVLRYSTILNGLGICKNDNEAKFSLINKKGKPFEHLFSSLKNYNDNNLYTVRSSLKENIPLHMKNIDKKYWFEHIKDNKMLYFQFNMIDDEDDRTTETFEQFTTRMWNYIDNNKNEIDKLVIDLRYNNGGNGRMVIPFIKEIIKRDWMNSSGKLFVLVGMETGSAAVVMATELLQYTEAIFVGDPPASPSNLFSDSKTAGLLPNSGFQLNIATRTIDNAWTENRELFPPDIPAPFTSWEYFSGSDPAINAIISHDAIPIDIIAQEKGNDSALKVFRDRKMKYPGMPCWHSSVEYRINKASYNFLHKSYYAKTEEERKSFFGITEQLLILNTLLFPDSSKVFNILGKVYMINGQKKLAIENYEKSLKLNPSNQSTINALKRLKKTNN